MALNANNKILADDFIELKRRVKNEMTRRKGQDSLTSYAGAAYDYTIVPAEGVVTKTEHVNKIITPLNAIAPTGEDLKTPGDIMKNIKNLETKLAVHETMSTAAGAATDCASSCSGLCRTGCFSGCSGCSGTCSGTCTGGCKGSCRGSCSCGCADNCNGDCYEVCADDCGGDCSDECSLYCGSSCTNQCMNDCHHTSI